MINTLDKMTDQQLLAEIDLSGIAWEKAGRLGMANYERKKVILRNYADILYTFILDSIRYLKDFLLEELEKAIKNPDLPMRVKIWDYSVTHRTDGGTACKRDMADFSNRGHHTVVFDNGKPVSVDILFRKTDICWRLAFTFGSHYSVTFVQDDIKAVTDEYSSYRISVYLNYHPNFRQTKELLSAYKDATGRRLYMGKDVCMTARF
jgi:hypothetical protein